MKTVSVLLQIYVMAGKWHNQNCILIDQKDRNKKLVRARETMHTIMREWADSAQHNNIKRHVL